MGQWQGLESDSECGCTCLSGEQGDMCRHGPSSKTIRKLLHGLGDKRTYFLHQDQPIGIVGWLQGSSGGEKGLRTFRMGIGHLLVVVMMEETDRISPE